MLERLARRILILTFLSSLLSGCGPQKLEAGEACDPSGSGSAKCRSSLCLEVGCASDSRFVCAGDRCSAGSCEGGQTCVQTTAGEAYCLPDDVCSSGPGF